MLGAHLRSGPPITAGWAEATRPASTSDRQALLCMLQIRWAPTHTAIRPKLQPRHRVTIQLTIATTGNVGATNGFATCSTLPAWWTPHNRAILTSVPAMELLTDPAVGESEGQAGYAASDLPVIGDLPNGYSMNFEFGGPPIEVRDVDMPQPTYRREPRTYRTWTNVLSW
jgi:hypothetical protein